MLIDSGIGDNGRLQHILETLRNGKKLYNSDQIYLDKILSNYDGHRDIPSTEDKSPVRSNDVHTEYMHPKQSKPKKPGPL